MAFLESIFSNISNIFLYYKKIPLPKPLCQELRVNGQHYPGGHITLGVILPQVLYEPICHITPSLLTPNNPLPSTNTFTTPHHLWPFCLLSHKFIAFPPPHAALPQSYAVDHTYISFPHFQHIRPFGISNCVGNRAPFSSFRVVSPDITFFPSPSDTTFS